MLLVVALFSCALLSRCIQSEPVFDKRALLADPNITITDRIILINEEKDALLYEGDIKLTGENVDFSNTGDVDGNSYKPNAKRAAQRNRKGLWKTRFIPYEVEASAAATHSANIQAAIDEFDKHTCIRWVPRTNETDWVKIVKKSGCWSSIGYNWQKYQPGFQELSLDDGCNHKGVIMHEFMHAMGFWHEQSRPDRNQHVEVMWENIQYGRAFNFDKFSTMITDVLGTIYDYDSIMHYGKMGFSSNGQPTLLPLGDPNRNIGQRQGLSASDIIEINALYDCTTVGGGWSQWTGWSPCSFCYKYRQRFCTAKDRSTNCPGGDPQTGIDVETLFCPPAECNAPLAGHWGRWSTWSTCSKTCDKGTITRTRKCDDPAPTNGGSNCVGKSSQDRECEKVACGLGPDDCFFSQGMCYWHQASTMLANSFRWIRIFGPTDTSNTGPSGDHTDGTGYYVFSESSSPVQQFQKAKFVSKEFPATTGRCLNFYYHMYGNGMGALRVFVKDKKTSTSNKILEFIGNKGNQWLRANSTVVSPNAYEVYFEAERGHNYYSDMALDDISFKEHACDYKATPAPTENETNKLVSDTCSFDAGFCSWTQDKTDTNKYPWYRKKGRTPSWKTGPASDHTSGKGRYIFVETSFPVKPGQTARLLSREFSASVGCFSFYYYMYGSGMGTLNVYIKDSSTGTLSNIFTKSGDQGTKWYRGLAAISTTGAFKIVLEAVSGPTHRSDIAVDDVLFIIGGSCPIPTLAPDVCDFGVSQPVTCGWTNDPMNSIVDDGGVTYYNWDTLRGPTPTAGTGPRSGRSGSGYYIYLESSCPLKQGMKGRILSKQYSPGTMCLDFWYYMYGATMGSLNLFLDTDPGKVLWTKSGDQSEVWKQGFVPVTSDSPFKIVFEGVRGTDSTGDIAIDDIKVSFHSCP